MIRNFCQKIHYDFQIFYALCFFIGTNDPLKYQTNITLNILFLSLKFAKVIGVADIYENDYRLCALICVRVCLVYKKRKKKKEKIGIDVIRRMLLIIVL